MSGCVETPPTPSVMLVADRGADRIRKFDGVTGEWLADVATIDRPSSMRRGPDGALYVAGFGDSAIVRVTDDGAQSVFFRDTQVLEEPVELLFRGAELAILGHDTHNAIMVDPTGAMVRDIGYPDMRGAHDFVIDDRARMYVATSHDVELGIAIQIWDLNNGRMIAMRGTLEEVANATGIVAIDDILYVTDYERGTIVRFAGDTRIIARGLVHPVAIELGLDGLLYVADERGIHRFERDGSYAGKLAGDHLTGVRSFVFEAVAN